MSLAISETCFVFFWKHSLLKSYFLCQDIKRDMSRDMTKPTKWVCAQRRLRSAWASAQSDQSLRCPHEETLGPKLPIERTAKTLIRLGRCPGWSESSLGAQPFCWFCHVMAHMNNKQNEPLHVKTCLSHMRKTKAQRLIHAVWSAPFFLLPR